MYFGLQSFRIISNLAQRSNPIVIPIHPSQHNPNSAHSSSSQLQLKPLQLTPPIPTQTQLKLSNPKLYPTQCQFNTNSCSSRRPRLVCNLIHANSNQTPLHSNCNFTQPERLQTSPLQLTATPIQPLAIQSTPSRSRLQHSHHKIVWNCYKMV